MSLSFTLLQSMFGLANMTHQGNQNVLNKNIIEPLILVNQCIHSSFASHSVCLHSPALSHAKRITALEIHNLKKKKKKKKLLHFIEIGFSWHTAGLISSFDAH